MAIARFALALISVPVALIIISPLVLLALPFWGVALLSRTATHVLARFQRRYVPWGDVMEYQPVIGWKPKPELDTYYLDAANDICHVATDAQGWPGKKSVSESQVLVFGDSHAFGYGVDAKASYAELVSKASVKGISAPGYSMVQEVLLMRQMSEQLGNKLVVWMICLDNDLYDNLNPERSNFYKAPFVRQVNGTGRWEIVTHHVIRSKAHRRSGPSPYYPFLAYLCTPGPISDRAYSASEYLIDEAKAICEQSGAILVVMAIPNKHQLSPSGVSFLASHMYNAPELNPGYPELRMAEACQRLGVRFIALRDYLRPGHYKVADVHWNEKGHRKVAEILDEIYAEYMYQGAKVD